MTIEWRGEGCFEIASTGGHFSLITELPSRDSGLLAPRSKTDVLISIWGGLEDTLFSKECIDRLVIAGPGEYEVKEVFIKGLKVSSRGASVKTIYKITMEDIKLGYLGELSKKEMNPDVIGFLDDIDILFVPVGGEGMLDAEDAVEIVNQIEPKIVIPMYYKIPNLKRKAGSLEAFLKEMGASNGHKPEEKLLVKFKDLNFEETKIIPLVPL